MRRAPIPLWFVVTALVVLLANILAGVTTTVTIGLMRGVSEFAVTARAYDVAVLPYYQALAYPGTTLLILAYVWPIAAYFRHGTPAPAPPRVQRRVVSGPFLVSAFGFAPWIIGALLFPLLTLQHLGHWSTDLMSQQVLSPIVNGFLAATTSYLVLDWVFRRMVVPHVFPGGQLADIPGAIVLGVRTRLFVFLLAVAFTPLFTVLGLIRASTSRVAAGLAVETVVPALAHASEITFVVYVALGVLLTLLLARTLTRPLSEMAAALRRVQAGDLNAGVQVTAGDEVGILGDGVNAMVQALREKERILQTFGRVVEPSVRDHLLAGNLRLGGELRTASVLFCDLRGFTAIAERTPPAEMVATLNEFFTAMTVWVRECGGFVDKFIGDAMLVVFGLFNANPADGHAHGAAAALRCAVGLRERLAEINAARTAAGQWPFAVSVGVHSGEVLAGTIGAKDRHEYTVIGDTVNVAARLQQLCKERGHGVLVSEQTYELARSQGFAAEVTMDASVSLRGRNEPVRVFCIA